MSSTPRTRSFTPSSNSNPRRFHQEPATRCARAGTGRKQGDPLVTPIVQSTTFCQTDIDGNAQHAYSRVSNPTVNALETALGELENAPPAVCFGTGLAAETALLLALLKPGDHLICGSAVYGGTTRLCRDVLVPLGIDVTFVDTTTVDAVSLAINDNTRAILVETPANPTLSLSDIRAISDIAHEHDARVIVDNTFLTPILQQPLELGADISVYSTTKLIDGQSSALGGAVVTRDEELLERIRFLRKCTGAIIAPFNAWLTLQGVRTLSLRVQQQSANAERIANWLYDHDAIACTSYPTFENESPQRIADVQHLGAHGAVVTFEIRGGIDAARILLQTVRDIRLVEHVGGAQTLLTHPASMTHADVPAAVRNNWGLTDGLLRLSVGLESPEDIIADLSQALDAVSISLDLHESEATPCKHSA